MKCSALLFVWTIAAASAQFGGFSSGFNSAYNRLPKVPFVKKLPSLPGVSDVKNFSDLLVQTGKSYASEAERKLREGYFSASKSLVDSVNSANSGFKLAINEFALLSLSELLTFLTGNKKSAQGEAKATEHRVSAFVKSDTTIPDSFDWREKGGVSPVSYQDTCGSCWSFATVGALEGHHFRKSGKLIPLSEQNLIDCGPIEFGLDGCDGGYQEYAFAFLVEQQKGIAGKNTYPYENKRNECKYSDALKVVDIKEFAVIQPKDEKTMKKIIATKGPLACSINGVQSLFLYKSGIYADDDCNKGEPNHSVLVVGYGSDDNGTDYWIVKNSWDKTWGEDGFFRLPRGNNFCSIAMECSYPVL